MSGSDRSVSESIGTWGRVELIGMIRLSKYLIMGFTE